MWAYPHRPTVDVSTRASSEFFSQCKVDRAVWAFPHCPQWFAKCRGCSVISGNSRTQDILQSLPISPVSPSLDFDSFSLDFQPKSKNCSPDELAVLQLRTPGLTSHEKCSGSLAGRDGHKSAQGKARRVQLKVLSVFAGPEHAPKVQEGAALLSDLLLVQVKEVDVSTLQLDKHKTWTLQAKELLSNVQHQKFDIVFVSLPAKGMARPLFANKQGPSPLRGKMYPYGFPWLSQQAKRVNDVVTTESAFLLTLALAAVTQNNPFMVLFAAEERSKAHFGEACSWWQTEDVRLLAHLGATRGAFYSCEIVKHWTGKSCLKPGSLGVMSNFSAQCKELKEGWPADLRRRAQVRLGPLSRNCNCGSRHQTLYTSKAQNFAVEAAVCAQFLKAFPRLPMERGRLSEARLAWAMENSTSPLLQTPTALDHFLFRQQPWLQAHWRAWQEQTGSKLNRTEEEREKRRECGMMEEGEGRGVEARHEGCKASLVASVERGVMD